jgi:hypothetical protein
MIKSIQKYRRVLFALLFVMLSTQSCVQVRVKPDPALPAAQEIESTATKEQSALPSTSTAQVEIPTATAIISTPKPSLPNVTISAVKGNTFIRRGPDMAFNPIGVFYKDTSAKVMARDVLSNWVQIQIPNSDKTGWLYIESQFLLIKGEIKDLPEFTPTDWPVAAYVRNCTHHRMWVWPGETVIASSYSHPDNEAWINPGSYRVYDIDVAGDPEVAQITIKEGSVIEIHEDALGERRICPKD